MPVLHPRPRPHHFPFRRGALRAAPRRDLFLASLATEGIADALIAKVDEAPGAPRFDTKTDRSVLASMNIALREMPARLDPDSTKM